MLKWYDENGEFTDVVISSRVRLARNLKKYPFSTRLSQEGAKALVEEVSGKLKDAKGEDGTLLACSLDTMDDVERTAMVERHILSPMLAEKKQSAGLLMSENEAICVLINEEDHLRIQGMAGGMNIQKAFERANRIDDMAEKAMEFAYDEKYGYLTSCPTNVGTGMRASYMMFLPALGAAGKINRLADEVGKYGAALRGMYGEGTEGTANIYQISNQKTLGSSEEDIIENLNNIALQVILQERKRREYVLMNNFEVIEDQIYRSYGVLKYTRQIGAKDAMTLLAQIKLGFDTGILKSNEPVNIFRMMMDIQPSNLQCRLGKNTGSMKRDKARAAYLNQNLPKL
ncbi:MAG: protein arginine kinase, partial [Acetivibrio ethanolgignens]